MDAHHDPIDQKCTQMRSVCTAAHAAEQAVGGLSDTLETPTRFAAADVIAHDDDGRLSFHYAIVEVTHPQPHAVWAMASSGEGAAQPATGCINSQEPLCAHVVAQRAPETVQLFDSSGVCALQMQVAALLQDPHAELKPGGDVDAAQWKEVGSLPGMRGELCRGPSSLGSKPS